MLKQYEYYLTKLFLKNIIIIFTVFIFLSFFLNIFEEIKYFQNKESSLYYPILLTILNIPSIIFEILPFIFLLGVMFFFIKIYENEEIELLRSNGIGNMKITMTISIVSLIIGIFLIVVYYSFSANFKSLYLSIKYKYSEAGDYLAVVNDDGLWIKEKSNDGSTIFIINAKTYKINKLEDLEIIELDNDFKLMNTIISSYKDDKIRDKINIVLCGGGRKNYFLRKMLSKKINKKLLLIEEITPIFGQYNGDFIESQAFAYLAIRSKLKLPISFPHTTGCKSPSTGGLIVKNF